MKKVCVVGAGAMGSGIAQVFAQAGYSVALVDTTDQAALQGRGKIEQSLGRMVTKGKLSETQKAEILGRVSASGDIGACVDSLLAVEAIYESIQAKRGIFSQLEGILEPEAIMVSNTSSISITEIAGALKNPERFCGMHFFNPAPVMKLVEVIGGVHTGGETLKRVMEIAKELGKTPVRVEEGPGFVVNRLLVPMINEAIGVCADGIAGAQDIDTAMKLGAGHPIGPLALGDLIGLDVCLAIMEVLQKETGDQKYRPHPLLRKMVRGGLLGKKSGKGFFTYE